MNRLEKLYFKWLCDKVIDKESPLKYTKLMKHLWEAPFMPLMSMDENRANDGLDLRWEFGRELNISQEQIEEDLNYRPEPECRIIEMMIALAIRCEETIMTDDRYGNRTGEWFWNMIVSLGLGTMNDTRYDRKYVNIIIDNFNNREYKKDGEGGLFTIRGIRKDMRNVEIWYQMCWYLDSL